MWAIAEQSTPDAPDSPELLLSPLVVAMPVDVSTALESADVDAVVIAPVDESPLGALALDVESPDHAGPLGSRPPWHATRPSMHAIARVYRGKVSRPSYLGSSPVTADIGERRPLHAHPLTPCAAVDEVVVDIGIAAGDVLIVRYAIIGDLDRLRLPTTGAGLDPARLWAHTCCEMFVAPAADEGYVEWNFSPSGQIARFEFSAYRQRTAAPPTTVAAPAVTVEGRALRLEARVPLSPHSRIHLGLTTVVEDATGALSYWALRHPRDRPDFHDADGFALALTLGPPLAIVDR